MSAWFLNMFSYSISPSQIPERCESFDAFSLNHVRMIRHRTWNSMFLFLLIPFAHFVHFWSRLIAYGTKSLYDENFTFKLSHLIWALYRIVEVIFHIILEHLGLFGMAWEKCHFSLSWQTKKATTTTRKYSKMKEWKHSKRQTKNEMFEWLRATLA